MAKTIAIFILSQFLIISAFAQQNINKERDSKVELYFGLRDTTGKKISEKKWERFVDTYITPSFPDGLTVIDANGQWKDSNNGKLIKERSKLLVLICPLNDKNRASIDTIKSKYKHLHKQQSVMEVDSPIDSVNFE